jgi:rare lipoprotein A
MASWMRRGAASAATALGLMMSSLTPALGSEGERVWQRGKASWYGAFHHGRRTASGEIFNQNALTAAHRSLPFGTRLRVTNHQTGRSTVVRVNDRGPFKANRIIDLSRAAAQAIGLQGVGLVVIALA